MISWKNYHCPKRSFCKIQVISPSLYLEYKEYPSKENKSKGKYSLQWGCISSSSCLSLRFEQSVHFVSGLLKKEIASYYASCFIKCVTKRTDCGLGLTAQISFSMFLDPQLVEIRIFFADYFFYLGCKGPFDEIKGSVPGTFPLKKP